MGERGPGKKPSNLAVLHGDRKDRVNKSEAKPPSTKPRMPSWMSNQAKSVWKRLAPDLIAHGLLTKWDVDTFAIWCEEVAKYRRAADLQKGSLLVKGAGDSLKKNPAHQISRDAATLVRMIGRDFGLTPSARAGIELPEDDANTAGIARLLAGVS